MENLSLGLLLMAVGMLTVFAILLIVIYGSQLLVNIVNKIAPEEAVPAKKAPAQDKNVAAVLQAAVSQLTGGKGIITRITEI